MGAWTDMWTAFDKLFDEDQSFWTEADRAAHRKRVMTKTVTPHGCVCPVGAEKTCKGATCPRRPIGPAS